MPSRSRAALIRGLSRRRNREAEGAFLAEGVRVVEDLLAAGIVPRFALVSSSLEDTERGAAVVRALENVTEVERVSDGELNGLAPTESPQGVLVVAPTPEWTLESLRPAARSVVLVADAVQDPGNLGTLLRTAEALGALGALLLPGTVDPWNSKVVRAAAGSAFRLPAVSVDVAALRAWLREHDVRLLGADAAGVDVATERHGGAVALAVGNEGAGLSDDVAAACHARVSVPQRGGAESLNVAAAAAILLYELTRGRNDGGSG